MTETQIQVQVRKMEKCAEDHPKLWIEFWFKQFINSVWGPITERKERENYIAAQLKDAIIKIDETEKDFYAMVKKTGAMETVVKTMFEVHKDKEKVKTALKDCKWIEFFELKDDANRAYIKYRDAN